ncbi:hypothetical protein VTO73DRAFT_78 [Trametes versicolor]
MATVQPFSLEIVARICGCCHRSTLLSLAKTCRAFSLIALKFLWSNISGLNNLFLTLPGCSVIRRDRDPESGISSIVLLLILRA